MNHLILVRVDRDATPTPAESDGRAWVRDTDAQGIRLFGSRLALAHKAKVVRVRDHETLVTDGPFPEAHELIAGFDFLETRDLEEAVAAAIAHPVAKYGAIEIRGEWPIEGCRTAPDGRFDGANRPPGTDLYLLMIGPVPAGEPVPPALESPARWIQKQTVAGTHIAGLRLRAPAETTTVRVRAGDPRVETGPFGGSGNQVAGVELIAAADMDEALSVAASHPDAQLGGIEVRPLWPWL